jgi:hypothetical protein
MIIPKKEPMNAAITYTGWGMVGPFEEPSECPCHRRK